jgi:MoxR-like ATPase
LAAKIRALFEGRFAASIDDVRAVALPALRHRTLLNFEGEAEGVKTDQVLEAILKALPETKTGAGREGAGTSGTPRAQETRGLS